jgi:hypothetical protein
MSAAIHQCERELFIDNSGAIADDGQAGLRQIDGHLLGDPELTKPCTKRSKSREDTPS